MHAIILAAGMGTRLGKYAENLPKCMLNFNGKPLIQWQVDALRAAGVTRITIVRGFKPEKIAVDGVVYKLNPDFANTNMVATLMQARDDIASSPDGVLVCYADIVYEPRLVSTVLAAPGDVSVLCDEAFLPYWQARLDEWQSDMESLVYTADDRLTELGEATADLPRTKARYIGLIKFSKEGARQLVRAFDENKATRWHTDEKWRHSKSFKKAYMTDMIQELIDRNVNVRVARVKHGWMEFDTAEDYEKATQWLEEGTLSRFITLP